MATTDLSVGGEGEVDIVCDDSGGLVWPRRVISGCVSKLRPQLVEQHRAGMRVNNTGRRMYMYIHVTHTHTPGHPNAADEVRYSPKCILCIIFGHTISTSWAAMELWFTDTLCTLYIFTPPQGLLAPGLYLWENFSFFFTVWFVCTCK